MLTEFTERLAYEVTETIRPTIEGAMDAGIVHRQALSMTLGTRQSEAPWYREVFHATFGSQPREEWEYPYDEIADGKAEITARTGLPSRVVVLTKPHLLLPGDVRFWGSWIEENIVVAASGVKPWFDEAFSKMGCGLVVAGLSQAHFEMDEAAERDGSIRL